MLKWIISSNRRMLRLLLWISPNQNLSLNFYRTIKLYCSFFDKKNIFWILKYIFLTVYHRIIISWKIRYIYKNYKKPYRIPFVVLLKETSKYLTYFIDCKHSLCFLRNIKRQFIKNAKVYLKIWGCKDIFINVFWLIEIKNNSL